MVQCIYPPQGFTCPYRNSCPHMGMLSTTYIYGEYRRSSNVYQEHLRCFDNYQETLRAKSERILLLERENAELKAKYQAIHQRQFKPNRKPKDDKGTGSQQQEKKNVAHQRGIQAGLAQNPLMSTRLLSLRHRHNVLIAKETSFDQWRRQQSISRRI